MSLSLLYAKANWFLALVPKIQLEALLREECGSLILLVYMVIALIRPRHPMMSQSGCTQHRGEI